MPAFTRAAGDNFLCASAPREAEVDALALGPLELLALPGEPTMARGRGRWRTLTGATHVLGLANGYVGYLDTPELVLGGQGESRRQYFGPALLERLGAAARVASGTVGFSAAGVSRTGFHAGARLPACPADLLTEQERGNPHR